MRPSAVNETYIGDGVHASFDGYQIWLRTEREGGDHYIALEPAVFERLLAYRDSLKALAGSSTSPGPAPAD